MIRESIHSDRETPDACRLKCNLYFSSNLSNRPKQYSKKKFFSPADVFQKKIWIKYYVSFASISIKGECRDRRFQLFFIFFSSFSWRDNLWTLVKKKKKKQSKIMALPAVFVRLLFKYWTTFDPKRGSDVYT